MPSLFEKAIKEKDHETVRQHLNEPPGLSLNVRNAASQTPMMIACQHDSIDALEEMLQIDGYENSIDAVESTGSTAIHYACESGFIEAVNHLTRRDAKVNLKNNIYLTPLHIAARDGFTEIVKILHKGGAHLEETGRRGKTALFFAVEKGHTDIVKY